MHAYYSCISMFLMGMLANVTLNLFRGKNKDSYFKSRHVLKSLHTTCLYIYICVCLCVCTVYICCSSLLDL